MQAVIFSSPRAPFHSNSSSQQADFQTDGFHVWQLFSILYLEPVPEEKTRWMRDLRGIEPE